MEYRGDSYEPKLIANQPILYAGWEDNETGGGTARANVGQPAGADGPQLAKWAGVIRPCGQVDRDSRPC